MAKYRKKPIEVEAEQWWPGKVVAGVHFRQEYTVEDLDGEHIVKTGPYVVTIHGQETLIAPGDWIITEPDGAHHYPCKDEIFRATYQEVVPTQECSS